MVPCGKSVSMQSFLLLYSNMHLA